MRFVYFVNCCALVGILMRWGTITTRFDLFPIFIDESLAWVDVDVESSLSLGQKHICSRNWWECVRRLLHIAGWTLRALYTDDDLLLHQLWVAFLKIVELQVLDWYVFFLRDYCMRLFWLFGSVYYHTLLISHHSYWREELFTWTEFFAVAIAHLYLLAVFEWFAEWTINLPRALNFCRPYDRRRWTLDPLVSFPVARAHGMVCLGHH